MLDVKEWSLTSVYATRIAGVLPGSHRRKTGGAGRNLAQGRPFQTSAEGLGDLPCRPPASFLHWAVIDEEKIRKGGDMPKMKTHKATAKRFKVTGTGKLRRLKVRRSHLRRRKSKRVRRGFDKDYPVDRVDRKRARRLLGLKKQK